MSLHNIPLRKLLKIMFLAVSPRRSAIREDIRTDRARSLAVPGDSSGGDFYGPFWADAKAHVFGQGNLYGMVDRRIAKKKQRKKLYIQLRNGFINWLNSQQNWKEPLETGKPLKIKYEFPELTSLVRVDSVLSVKDAKGDEYYIYPYFAPEPKLTEEAAKLGLWLLQQALPQNIKHDQIHILDVIRGRSFSINDNELSGEEERSFRKRYESLLKERDELVKEYN